MADYLTVNGRMLPTHPSAALPLPAGFDGGNGYCKLALEGRKIKLPSHLLLANDQNTYPSIEGTGSTVKYLSGSRADLIGQRWVGGSGAYLNSPLGHLRVSDDLQGGKSRYGLQLLLSALGTLPAQDWNLELVVSLPDAQAFGGELERVFSGVHTVQFEDSRPCTVNIQATCLEEGLGTLAYGVQQGLCNMTSQTTLLDIGYGTVIGTAFRGKTLLPQGRKVLGNGVYGLVDRIGRNLEVRKRLGQYGEEEIIRRGIEEGSFLYGRFQPWDFRPIYTQELREWLQSVLSPAIRGIEHWKTASEAVLLCGGGTQLPLLAELLATKGYQVVPSPQWANALGLLACAQVKARRAAQ